VIKTDWEGSQIEQELLGCPRRLEITLHAITQESRCLGRTK
jgi:hypothetical protein